MRLDDGIEIKEKEREGVREREGKCIWRVAVGLVCWNCYCCAHQDVEARGSSWNQSDIKAMSSAATVPLLRVLYTHTDKSEKYPSHGILKNAKSWGNRQIICGIVIKLNASSCSSSPLSKLQRVAESHFLFIIRLYGIQMFEKCSRKNGEQRERW